jgi:3-oxoadipate enol-lactonase
MHVVEAGEGRPVVLLHGLGWTHELWQSAIAALSRRYRIIAGDTRGHGHSDKPAGPYSIQQFSADWHGVLRALGVERACIVGFSQGGMIAQLLALEHPEDVGALVLACTVCKSNPAGRQILEERIKKARTTGAEAAARLAARGIFSSGFVANNPDKVEWFVKWRAAMDQDALVEATRAAYGFDVADRLREVQVPALVVYGEEDALTPPDVAKEVARALPDGTAMLAVPNAGHMIPFEQPETFERILIRFLDKHYPAN